LSSHSSLHRECDHRPADISPNLQIARALHQPTGPFGLRRSDSAPGCGREKRWARRCTSAAGLAMRSRIVLAAADRGSNTGLSQRLDLAITTVRRWHNRFAKYRLVGYWTSRPRADHALLVISRSKRLSPRHWKPRRRTLRTGQHGRCSSIWACRSRQSRGRRGVGIGSARTESWKLSADPLFGEKVRDIVWLYLNRRCQAYAIQLYYIRLSRLESEPVDRW